MKTLWANGAKAVVATALVFSMQLAHADDPIEKVERDAARVAAMCDFDKDGMVSKTEMMKMVEKAWDKADPKKTGRLDK
ncbi:MAG: hypothetical protein ACRCV9_17525, partial [Burkholderiaceae bacterium]